MEREGVADGLRLAELLATLSLGADLGLGQPMEHVLRSCLVATRLGERMGLDDDERAAVYYASLLAWVGCTADSSELSRWFGDDISFRAASYDVDLAGSAAFRFLLRHAGAGGSPLHRTRLAAALVVTGGRALEEAMAAHCRVAVAVAERLGLGPDVCVPLAQNFARWDGKGLPAGLAAEDIALPMRIVHLADLVEVFHRSGGVEAAVQVARERRGTQLDPAVVDAFCACAGELLGGLDQDADWDALIEAEPALRPRLSEAQIDLAMEATADLVDLKSRYLHGHSRGVADLAAAAATHMGLPAADVILVRRAALLHDLGRAGVPNTIWDKPGPLSAPERERVRLHAYYTERMLARPPVLARVGAVAALHHERLDGSGYHRGVPGASIPAVARLVAAADAYHAMTEPRPHRAALDPDRARDELRGEVRAGRIAADAADAVLGAAGHRVGRRRTLPAGLTAREAEVLTLLARGASNKEIAQSLHISRKTVDNHVEHAYTKLGVSSRAAATYFAIQHGLLDTLGGERWGDPPMPAAQPVS